MRWKKIAALLALVFFVFSFVAFPVLAAPAGGETLERELQAEAYRKILQDSGGKAQFGWDQKKKVPIFVRGKLGSKKITSAVDALGAVNAQRRLFLMDSASEELKLKKESKDKLGYGHYKFTQVYKGVPVFGREIIVHTDKNGYPAVINGNYDPVVKKKKPETTPLITSAQALEIAKKETGLTGVKEFKKEQASLYLYETKKGDYLLVYVVTLSTLAGKKPFYGDVLVDACRGNVVKIIDRLAKASTVGTGVGVFGANRTFNTDYDGTIYYLRDLTRNIETHTANFGTDVYTTTLMSDPDNYWDDGAAVDAHYHAAVVYDYFQNQFSRQSYDGLGALIKAVVHYGNGYNNAFWDGAELVFGDGDGTTFAPFPAALDVVGHEFTHAVVDNTAGLIYEEQSGALSESLADIFGNLIENDSEWLVGEDIYTPAVSGDALRSMASPSQFGQPEKMSDYRYVNYDNGGVHINSGIPNKAFYKFITAPGITREMAAQIYFRALTFYLTSGATFLDARYATIAAAVDLYGEGSPAVAALVSAWDSVGVKNEVPADQEPNDEMAQASGPLSAETFYSGTISDIYDVDWYKFVLPATGSIRILLNVPVDTDYDIELYDANGKLLSYSDQASSWEKIVYDNNGAGAPPGTYYLKVFPYVSPSTQPYTFIVSLTGTTSYPQIVSVTPSNGLKPAGTPVTFTLKAKDGQGYQNLQGIFFYLLDDYNNAVGAMVLYDRSSNRLYLLGDGGELLGGYAPGTQVVVENSYFTLLVEKCSVAAASTELNLTLCGIPKDSMAGLSYSLFGMAENAQGYDTGFVPLGTWGVTRNYHPFVDKVTPTGSSLPAGTPFYLTVTGGDTNGYDHVEEAYVLLTNVNVPLFEKGVYIRYNRSENKIYLSNDNGTDWLGGIAPGNTATISNSYVTVYPQYSSFSGSGNNFTLKLYIAPKSTLAGMTLYEFARVVDGSNASSAWEYTGTWTVATNYAPVNGTVSPASGSLPAGTPVYFTVTGSDANGYGHISHVYFMLNSSNSYTLGKGMYVYYDRGANKLYLRNDTNTGWLGGIALGSTATISNSYVTVYPQYSSFSGSGNNFVLKLYVVPKSTLAGLTLYEYMNIRDGSAAYAGWKNTGTWKVVTNYAPVNGTVSPASGSLPAGTPVYFTVTGSDANGYGHISHVYFMLNSSNSYTLGKGMYVYYDRGANKLYLRNDTNTGWLGGIALGSTATISNSYVTVYPQYSSFSGSGNNFVLKLYVVPKSTLAGLKLYKYMTIRDRSAVYSGWKYTGTWAVTTNYAPVVGPVTPSSGGARYGTGTYFTLTGSDANGYEHITHVYFMLNSSNNPTLTKGMYVYYDRGAKKLYLRNDTNSAWLGGVTLGSTTTISNSYVTVYPQYSSFSGSGNNFTLKLYVVPKSTLAGLTLYEYMNIRDGSAAYAGWKNTGTWKVLP